MKRTNCIVIPIYKDYEILSSEEQTSLSQLYNILSKHQIIFAGPKELKWDSYLKDAAEKNIFPLIKEFSADFFFGLSGYNKLMISLEFYQAFKKYNYLLIYQLDSIVFRDELQYWCGKGYDYIGAPWFKGWLIPDPANKIIGVGNGGFSLRNVRSTLRVLRKVSILKKVQNFWFYTKLERVLKLARILGYLKKPLKIREISNFYKVINSVVNEDIYLSQIIPSCFADYKIAPAEDAIKFSFEVNAAYLFEKNSYQLPFGCHAWQKYEAEFWKEFIPGSPRIMEKKTTA